MALRNDQQQKNLVRERFTRTAEVFADFAVRHRSREADLLARYVAASSHDRAVDLACGPGTLALRFARHVRWICGVDLTPAMLERMRCSAAAEGISNLASALGDAQALPFGDGSFDIAVTSYSLHHVPEPARVIREMARVVRSHGRVGVLDIVSPEDREGAELRDRIEKARDPSHTRTLSRRELEAMFAGAGLRLLSVEMETHPRSFDHWMHVAGWERRDREYLATRKLLEATIPDDAAGFHPRYALAATSGAHEEPDIDLTMTVLFAAAERK
jgi:ubiquinone/menaquinone biosynthesis C-methylase UbiE